MKSEEKVTIPKLRAMKQAGEKLTALTAYDYPTALLMDRAGIEIVLVGDSVGNNMLGYESTIPVTMEEMLHHTRAVCRGVKRALLIGDMPFLSYNASNEQAILNAGRFLKESGAEAVKLEGGAEMAERVAALDRAGIGVMGHIGLTPQRVSQLGGYGVQGQDEARARRLLDDAIALEEAGAFSIVLEKIPWQLAKLITERLKIPTIGIGAGPHCDGQVLVTNDLLGLSGLSIKFAKRYLNLNELIGKALSEYKQDVKSRRFPTIEEHSFPMSQEIVDKLAD